MAFVFFLRRLLVLVTMLMFCAKASFAQEFYEYRASGVNSVGSWAATPSAAMPSWQAAVHANYPGACVPNGGYSSKYTVSNIVIPDDPDPRAFTFDVFFTGYDSSTCALGSTGSANPSAGVISKRLLSCSANASPGPLGCQCNTGYQWNHDQTSCLPEIPPDDGSCPVGYVMDAGVCVPKCPNGQMRIDGVCKDPECDKPAGGLVPGMGDHVWSADGYGGGTFCKDKCEISPSMRGMKDGKWYAWAPFTYTGAACTGDPRPADPPLPPDAPPPGPDDPPHNPEPDPSPPPPVEPPFSCSVGRCPGNVNGVDICVPCDKGVIPPTPPSPPGGAPGDGPPVGGGPGDGGPGDGGGGGVGPPIVCDSLRCTVPGPNPGDPSEEVPKDEFCAKNPRSPLCVTGSFGGACGSPFTCEGDPVMCATAKAVNEQKCALEVKPDDVTYLIGSGAMTGDNPSDHPRSHAVDTPVGTLNQTNPFGGGSVGDLTVTNFMGSPIVIPLSAYSSIFAMLGNILVGLSLLVGAIVVVRGKS